MAMKECVSQLTRNLLNSALFRESEQGVVVFRKMLELLERSTSDVETLDVLEKLNEALVGMEAHGYLTPEEFRWVQELRAIAESQVE